MKKIILLVFVTLFCCIDYSQAQTTEKKMTRQEKKEAQKAMEQALFEEARQAIENKAFTLEADRVIFKRGRNAFVSSNTNFVMVDDDRASVQVAFNIPASGPNGLGGVTVDGNVSGYKIKTDKSGQELVSDEIISPNACHNGVIYYNGTDKDHNLYALDTRSDSTSLLLEGNICYPVYAYDYIYYMDASSNYRLCRYSLSTGAVEVLTEDRVDTYNVGSGYVYYQKNDADAPALMRMEADGSNPEVVALGIYSDINLTSQYAYFHEFNSDVPMKRTPHSYIEVSDFNAAKQAAMASD